MNRRQFTLWHLFGLMTLVYILAAFREQVICATLAAAFVALPLVGAAAFVTLFMLPLALTFKAIDKIKHRSDDSQT